MKVLPQRPQVPSGPAQLVARSRLIDQARDSVLWPNKHDPWSLLHWLQRVQQEPVHLLRSHEASWLLQGLHSTPVQVKPHGHCVEATYLNFAELNLYSDSEDEERPNTCLHWKIGQARCWSAQLTPAEDSVKSIIQERWKREKFSSDLNES